MPCVGVGPDCDVVEGVGIPCAVTEGDVMPVPVGAGETFGVDEGWVVVEGVCVIDGLEAY